MKLKKLAFIIIITLLTIMLVSIFNVSNAATASEPKYLTIKQLRSTGYGYRALGKNIWKIVEATSDSNDAPVSYDNTIYCLKAGPGFGSSEFGNGAPTVRPYTRYFDMTDSDFINSNDIYRKVLPTDSTTYSALLWILEHAYVAPAPGANDTVRDTADEYRTTLLNAAGLNNTSLTDDDIDVVQQLAIWHFTNTGDSYDVEMDGSDTFELYVTLEPGTDEDYNYIALSAEEYWGDEGYYRALDAITLYNYLVDTALAEAEAGYTPTTNTGYTLAKNLGSTLQESGNNYIVGPFKIEGTKNSNVTLNGSFTDESGSPINVIRYQNADGTTTYNSLEDTIGNEFYIVVSNTTNIDTVTLTINGSYFNTTVTYWSVEGADTADQPVAIVERTKETYEDSVTNIRPPEEIFDLALRKFISSITSANGEAVTTPENRIPEISDEEKQALAGGNKTTAGKIHSKTPLIVNIGDTVLYTIRVYNEGNIDGYVTEITDYLPNGLTLKENSTINTQYGWVEGANGEITTDITSPDTANTNQSTIYADRKAGSDKVILEAFDGNTLDYIDVQIECVVTASVSDENTNLKNIAEITGATNSEGENITDIDSIPDNVTDYYDNDYNPGTSEQGWGYEDDDDFEELVILGKYFDLSLRKFIIQVNDTELKDDDGNYLRAPVVDTTPLTSGSSITTAIYNHPKNPLQIAIGDEVIYTIRVYNEGQIDGYVYEITDYLPSNLEFINDEFNASYGWRVGEDGRTVTTDITSPDTQYSASRDTIYENRKEGADKVILKAFDGAELDYIDVQIKCRVKNTAVAEEKLTNIAEITDYRDSEGQDITDRDSIKDNVTLPSDETLPNYKDEEINRGDQYIQGQQDDDDFEKVIIQKFDLSLRKFITGVNDNVVTNREPVFSIVDGEYVYTHTKEPVEVATGDTVIYTLRVYNEGDIAGYAEEIKDDIPEGLEFLPDNTTNINYRWVMYNANGEVTENVAEAVTIRTDYLSKAQEEETGRDNLIAGFDPETMEEPDYKEVRIAFRVTMPNTSDRIIINTAEISEDSNENGDPVEDVDSTPDNDEDGEDDIDIEKVKVKYFDLALRKFITGVNDQEITNRVPIFNNNNGDYTYTHPKDPVEVASGDIVIYTLRVYNEGTQAGYAEEVKDDLPEGLEFLPDNSINTEFRWVMYDSNGNVTENVEEAVSIRTDYLSKAQEDATGRDNLIDGFDSNTMTQPDYRDLQIAFMVTEPNTSDRILINTAEVSEDSNENGEPVEDIDSTPDNNEDGEDDIDIEKVKVTYFDLALKKIISKVTMTLDGETTVEETGHDFDVVPEPPVKIELGNHKINDAVIKFTYQIRITNEGNKAGYAYEIKDYIPEGLEFVEEDNEGWILSDDGQTVTTTQLSETLLEPGDSTVIEITFRWINGHNNLGVKTNWAEISEDSDDDIDSTPDNFEKGEDDIDDAEVVLSIVTGIGEHYVGVITAVLIILAGGIMLIKKFVL